MVRFWACPVVPLSRDKKNPCPVVSFVPGQLKDVWRNCGNVDVARDVSTPSFGSHLNPIPTKGGSRLCPPYNDDPTKIWKPHVFWPKNYFGLILGQNGFSYTIVHIAPLLSPQQSSAVSSLTAKMHFLAKTSVIYTAAKGTPPTYQIGFIQFFH